MPIDTPRILMELYLTSNETPSRPTYSNGQHMTTEYSILVIPKKMIVLLSKPNYQKTVLKLFNIFLLYDSNVSL